MNETAEILCTFAEGGLASVLLNRPQALNALTREMAVALDAALTAWTADDRVKAVVIRGAGGRAFCAGGDIRRLYDEGRAGGRYPYDFYRDEYCCNARLHHFPKPYVALLDGIVMGGGVGVSVHGSHRVVTENTLFAMPETGIGLFPDVGGTFFLPRLPGALGLYLGLTGARLKAADALHAGIGGCHVPAARLDEMVAALAAALKAAPAAAARATVDTVLARFHVDPGPPPLAAQRAMIDRVFAQASVDEILAALAAEAGDFAAGLLAGLKTKSPTSLKLTHRQIRAGIGRPFEDCMRLEWRMVNRIVAGHDFYEGTRAVVVDKDQKPAWRPASLAAVTDAAIEAYLAPLPEGDLRFAWEE